MGRNPRCSKDGLNKGAWTTDEDKMLTDYIKIYGEGKWSNVAKETGLRRCGKSCRLRWMNYLRPDIKRGNITPDEEELIIRLHKLLGNRWSLIAGRLPGRTDNEIKNYWNTNLAKKATELSVHSNNEKKPKIRNFQDHEPSATAARANSVPGTNVTGPPEEHKGQDHSNNDEIPPYVECNWPKNTTHETDRSSDGSPSSMSGEENFMMDFNMDDFCKILDSDFTKFNDPNNLVEGDAGISECKIETSPSFREKMEEKYWRGGEGVQADMASEFLSLASSFLESAEEWPGDDLNIAHVH